jgi:hypothetical protein
MSRRIQISMAVVAVITIGVSLGSLAMLRIREVNEFREPHLVETYGRTNYVVQLTKVTVGKAETGCVLIVYLRLQNPNAYTVTLRRN